MSRLRQVLLGYVLHPLHSLQRLERAMYESAFRTGLRRW